MAMTLQAATASAKPLRPNPRVGAVRKIALLGSHSSTLHWAPWDDPSWEMWGHAACRFNYKRELDRYFDLHSPSLRKRPGERQKKYNDWLSRNTVPLYMQKKFSDIPASIRYPKERILLEYGGIRRYFKNQVAWMIALAFSEGVTHLGLFGINYSHFSEYATQRGSAEYWLGRAEERGIHLVLPDECSLLAVPEGLYGYESHDEDGLRLPAYEDFGPKPEDKITPIKPGDKVVRCEPPPDLVPLIEEEEAQRPAWAKWEPIGKSNGGVHAS